MSSKLIPRRFRGRVLLFVLTLIAGFLGMASHSTMPASADFSDWCSDGYPSDAPQLNILEWPVKVGIEIWTSVPAGAVCYSTAPSGVPLAGGAVSTAVVVNPSTSPSAWARLACYSDSGVQVPLGCEAQVSAGTGPSITSYGDGTHAVSLPFSVCAAVCVNGAPNVQKTGVVLGTLDPISGPGTGVGYRLSNVAVYVNGLLVVSTPVDIGGAFLDPHLPGLSTPSISGGSPCTIGNVCVPTFAGMLGITGATTTVTLYLPVAGGVSVPVTVPSTCLLNFSGSC